MLNLKPRFVVIVKSHFIERVWINFLSRTTNEMIRCAFNVKTFLVFFSFFLSWRVDLAKSVLRNYFESDLLRITTRLSLELVTECGHDSELVHFLKHLLIFISLSGLTILCDLALFLLVL